MNTAFLELDELQIEFTYERQQAEPEVGYLVDFWSWDVKAVYLVSDLLTGEYDLLDQLSTKDLGRIDDEIEEYLNNK